MTTPLRLCLIGCGHMGRLRAQAALCYAHPVSLVVADVAAQQAAALASQLGLSAIELGEALAGDFDAVILSSSATAHVEQLAALAARPAPVFCEKPLAATLADAEQAWPALQRLEGRLQIGFNRRFDDAHCALRQHIASGALGRIEQMRIVSRDHIPPRPDGLGRSAGIIAETSIHDLDKARWLLGEEFVDVSCVAGAVINPAYAAVGHHDTVTLVLTAASGAQVIVQNGWRSAYGYDQRVEVFGVLGELRLPNPQLPGDAAPAQPTQPLHAEPSTLPGWAERYAQSFVAETHAFLDCVRTGHVPEPGLADALAAQHLVDAAREAAATGRRIAVGAGRDGA